MNRALAFELYVVVGLLTAAWVAGRKESWGLRLAAVPLWPFLLPAVLGSHDGPPRASSQAEAQLDELAQRVAESWVRGPAASVEGARERQVIEGFIVRLRGVTRRIAEIEAAFDQAPTRAKAPLRKMAESASAEVAAGTELLEELLAQLVLLRFAATPTAGVYTDRARIEDLLARIEEVVTLQTGPA
jgi:hypothetical protein